MKKKLLSLALALVLGLSLAVPAFAAESDFTIEYDSFIAYHDQGDTVIIPDTVTSIGEAAFRGHTELTSVPIPSSVTQIWMGAFGISTNLKDVYYTGSQEQWEKIEIWFSNDPLGNATIHYNSACSASSVPPNIFTDVKSSDYFADVVQWAVEKDITSGTGGSNFSPNSTCTRGQIVTFLHRAMGK